MILDELTEMLEYVERYISELRELKANLWKLAAENITLKRENQEMDKKIAKIEAKEKSALKETKELKKMDKKRDVLVEKGKKMKNGKC